MRLEVILLYIKDFRGVKDLKNGQERYISLFQHKKAYVLSRFYTTALLWFPKKTYTLAGFEPGSSGPKANAMATAPRRQGKKGGGGKYSYSLSLIDSTLLN
jgi:hypothetical protein